MAKRRSRSRRRKELQWLQWGRSNACEHQSLENKDNRNGVVVLGVYIHCEGCGNEVLKCHRGFEGVEEVQIDAENHKVIGKGKKADPIKVAERLRKKRGKHVELIHPKPMKQEKGEKKPEVIEVVLKINIHCDGCANEVKHCIQDMEGVQTVDPDMEKNLVTVKGSTKARQVHQQERWKTCRDCEAKQ